MKTNPLKHAEYNAGINDGQNEERMSRFNTDIYDIVK